MISNTMTDDTYYSTITPPPGTPVGSVRMRIRITYDDDLETCGITNYGKIYVDPCGITTWGEKLKITQ